MITKTNATLTNLKNLFIEIFLDKTNKVNNVADGSIVNANAFGVSKLAQKAMKDIAITEAQIFPDSATGEYLDKAAALYGVSPRKGALGSSIYVRVYASPGTVYDETNYFINKNGIRFSVDEKLTIGDSGYGYVKVRSVNAGYSTNVPPNSIVNVAPIPTGHIECTNEYYAVGGRDSEDDETFRVRIKNNLNVLSKGTIEYFTQIFQNLDDRVLKVMNVGLDEKGYFVLYIVAQNGIYFTESELETLLNQSQEYFGLSELNLNGEVTGIVLKNAEWFYVGSERGMDFRLDLVPGYDVATVRKNIQVALTKYLDFRFWEAGQVVEWDDLFDIVKKSEGVKYVPDQYFFPYYDEQVPINQLPRIRGFVMRDADGNILYDSDSTLSPTFYPQDSEDIFRGLSDNSLFLSQQVYFTVVDEYGNPVEGARISAGNNIIITDANGQATLSLVNGSYNYSITKKNYETINGSFVVLNSSVSISAILNLAPWTVTFTVRDEKDSLVQNATIAVGDKTATTNSNGVATMNLKNGTYSYTITKLGYDQITGKSFTVNDSDISISETMYFYAWQTTFVILSEADSKPIPSAIIEIGNNSYITNSQGQVTVPLINGTYNLTIKKVGYQETKKTIVILNQDTTITYTIPLFEYNVVMTVVQEDGLTPIAGAAFSIKNSSVSGITDSNGQLSFKLVNGSYDYLLTKKEFDDLSGSFNINNSDLDLELTMTLKHFTVLISAVDENGDPVENALVNINNEVLTTNDQGQVTALLQNGNYPFTITKIGYNDYTGNVVVTDQNTSIVANMTFYLWQILFTIKGKNNLPLNNASLNIYGQTYQSDENGQIEVRLKNGTYPYSITYLGYDDYQSNLVVLNKNESIDVLMQEKTYAVIFSVTGLGGIALQGVTITVGDKSTTTNEGGIATLSLVNGSYSYTTNKDGYVTSSGDFIVNNAEVPISVNMTPMSYDIVFKVTDDNTTSPNPLANVEIKINDQTLSTNNQGEVSLRIYGGDYVVSYTLAGYVSVTQEISIVKDETFEQILKKIWNLIFSVVAATKEPLVGATVRVQGSTIIGGEKTLTTKADGTTDPIEITNGQYTYGASMEGYSPEEGSGEIKDADKTQTIDLVFGFETTFVAKEGETPIQGVSIIVDNVSILTTGTDGTAKLNLSNGQHTYTYAKDGYMSGSGNITVAGTTQSIDIALIAGGLVTFTAVYNENPLAGVEITINNATRALPQTITTNEGGIATIELPNGNYEYTTHITGYKDKEATAFTVSSANLPLPVDLTYYKYYTVDFSTLPAVEGVSINIGRPTNDASIYIFSPLVFNNIDLTTNSEGKASTQLLSGTYKFTATKDKYLEVSENFTIEQSNKSITISMSLLSTVTFTVKDQTDSSPIVGASIKMTGINNPENVYVGTTDETGVATMAVQQGGKSYVGVLYDTYNYTVTPPSPYQSTSGTLEVNTSAINKEVLLIGNYDVTFNVKGKKKKEFIFRPQIGDFVYGDKTWSKILNPNKTCVGVITDVRSRDFDFVALQQSDSLLRLDVRETTYPGVTLFINADAALMDISGKATTSIITSVSPDSSLCNYVNSYGTEGFPAGSWFIPAAGQLLPLVTYKDVLNASLTAAGGILVNQSNTNSIWSCTSTDTNYACRLLNGSNALSTTYKDNSHYGRAFCTYEYNPVPNGIYIYDKNNDYYTKEQWTAAGKTSEDAVGVGVVTDNAQFVISPDQYYELKYQTSDTVISNIVTIEGREDIARKDCRGKSNTNEMIRSMGSAVVPAAEYCNGYSFLNGQKGYLPGVGEWREAYYNKSEVDACMSLIGGAAIIANNYYWASTQYKVGYGWKFYYTAGSATYESKGATTLYARPFAELPFKEYRGTYILDKGNGLYNSDDYLTKLRDNKTVTKTGFSIQAISSIDDSLIVGINTNTVGQTTSILILFSENIAKNYVLFTYDGSASEINEIAEQAVASESNYISISYSSSANRKVLLAPISYQPVGIAVIEPESQFIISPSESSSYLTWGSRGVMITGIATTKDSATAIRDYAGSSNTKQIISQLGAEGAPATGYCANYIFPNGQKGYLPAIGQWQEIFNNKSEIDTYMSLIGGMAIRTNQYHWSSTQYDSFQSWVFLWSDGRGATNAPKNDVYQVRAFADLIVYDRVPLENAIITPDNDSSKQVTTNAQGQAVISLKAGIDHDYSIQAEGYITREGTTGVLTSPITLDWTLNMATDFTFVLRADTESGPFIKGASIHVTSVEGSLIPIDITKETDTAGIAIFSLAEGTYDVVITAPNYKFEPLYNISVQNNVPGTLSIVGTGSYDLNVTVNRNNVGAANRTVNLYSSTMSQDTVLGEILSEMGCVLFKRTGDKAGTFIRLDKNTRLKYFDGSPAKTDGTEGDVMVYMPEYYYKYENLGGTKFAYRFSRVSLGDDWIHVPASLIGAYMCYCTDNKMYSRSGVNPTASISWTNFNNYAIARGTGYQMIDYWQHCQIAMLFYAKYKNRNSQAVLGVGSATRNPITTAGGTDNLGNNDTQQTTSGWVNFQGIEGVHGGAYECVGGVSISNRVWTITNPDGTTRTINAGTSNGWITKMALENGPYFDMVPTAVGGSDSTYYSDYYYQNTGTYVLYRSYDSAFTNGGVAYAGAGNTASYVDASIGSRLAFRGVLTESKSVSDYTAITAV